MKKTLFMTTLFAAAAMFAADAAPSKTEIKDDFTAKVWSHWNTSKVKAKYSHNKTEGVTAKGAAQINTTTPGSACFLKRYEVEPSSLYQVEVMVKSTTPGVKASLGLQDFGLNQKFVKVIGSQTASPSAEWQKIVYYFKTGAKTKWVQVLLDQYCATPATTLFDDFKMTKVDYISEFYDSFAANNWGNWKAAGAKIKFGHDATVGKKAPGAAKIEILPGNIKSGCATKHIYVTPGKTYTLVVWVKAKGLSPNAKLSLSFQAQDENYKFLGLAIPSRTITAADCADWKQIVITRKIVPTGKWAKCRTILVTLGAGSSSTPGTAYFDDFEFFEEEDEEE